MVDAVPSPDGRRIAFGQITGDSGTVDLFLREANGTVRRLTHAPGDDVDPTWSPDGRYLAFRTMRWNATGEFDLGILDLATGAMRQLTGGKDSDLHPRWSPDGSRIGFVRQRDADGVRLLCWVTFDGSRSRCLDEMPGSPNELAGWRDPDHLVTTTYSADRKAGPLLSVAVSTGATQIIAPGADGLPFLSSDGEWMTFAERDSTRIFRIDEPMRRRSLAIPQESRTWFEPRRRLPGPPALRPTPTRLAFAGVPQLLSIERDSTSGYGYPAEVLTWRPQDTAIAVVLPDRNVVLPEKAGATVIEVSAGGWRTASVPLTVTEPWSRVVFSEPWDDAALGRWQTVGTPKPLVVLDEEGNSAFFINGDNTFESGVVSREAFPGDSGLGFEARIRIPITETKWQFIHVTLGTLGRIIDYGGVSIDGCPLSFPLGEGRAVRKVVGLKADSPGGDTRGPVELGDGNWHTIRIQIFPDRTCGYAFDGVPFSRSTKPTVSSVRIFAWRSRVSR